MNSAKFLRTPFLQNTFFTEHLRTTASALSFLEAATGGVLWFAKISKTPFLQNALGRLLLSFSCNVTKIGYCQQMNIQCLETLTLEVPFRYIFFFSTYMRRHRDVLMGRRGDVPLRRLGNVQLRCRWVFHLRLVWDSVETCWWDVFVTTFWDVVTMFQKDVVETYHWDLLVTFHRGVVWCFIWDVPATSLGRTERRRYDVATTS